MKTIAFFSLLIFTLLGAITALTRPDILEKKYLEVRAAIDQYLAEKNRKKWIAAKDSDLAAWNLKLNLPADCDAPKSALRELECKNKVRLHAQTFEQIWLNKIKTGWEPDGDRN